ncbi:FAD:protein FMN transferase [Persicobacter psychrovividus]|uniref:FAD:protein FMN transferase n=1 Tax=Persicobacter psychrovividus TaxID=387638 RepID=A0ABN6L5X5_9BACT|nr:FAD:protein FMN transferase [Persicobacter psychrovividus]
MSQQSRPKLNLKSFIYPAILLLLMWAVHLYRDHQHQQNVSEHTKNMVYLEGETMGTYYHIKYIDPQGRNFKTQVDSLLVAFNQSQSTYIPTSEISVFNKNHGLTYQSPYFYQVLKTSKQVYEATDGAFDPTVLPLVKAWGFGPGKKDEMTPHKVDSLKALVDFKSISFDSLAAQKSRPEVQLDFSALAKGYGVDVVTDYIRAQGIDNIMVEIGGEVDCYGISDKNQAWVIGIDEPLTADELKARGGGRQLFAAIQVQDRGMATSGNYRNYYIENGKKYAHTIDPKSGYPVQHSILSATVLAPNCMIADAYATAFMVMGVEKAKTVLQQHPELDAYLIYSDENGKLKVYATKKAEQSMINIRKS